jgi:hypothetical protein
MLTTMTPTTHLDVLDAAEHLPLSVQCWSLMTSAGMSTNCSLQDLDGRRNPRLSYDCGGLRL